MLSIKDNVVSEVVIKRSRFITYLYRIDEFDCINDILDCLSAKYKDATHICFAYIIDGVKRFSDNGEPNGTAGKPILGVLENKNLEHVLCCVVRYFGGTKLGANGLIRAYSGCCNLAINDSSLVLLLPGKLCSIVYDYNDTKIIDNLLSNCTIISREYGNLVSCVFKVSDEYYNMHSELDKFNFKIIKDCYIEKEQ